MIIQGHELTRDTTVDAGVVIVGTGCGGAVLAMELSLAGIDVVMVEEGGHYTVEQYGKFKPSEALRHLYRDLGALPAIGLGDTPSILLLVGKAVGGSSLVNGGVCFRTPDHILAHWREGLGLTQLDEAGWEPAFAQVEKTLQVSRVPDNMHSAAVRKLIDASRAKGWSGHALDRNVVDCDGCCRCIFGCPHDAKRPVTLNYLDTAQAHGTRIYSDCRVEKILVKRGKAAGVVGRIRDRESGRHGPKLTVKAPVVILTAGATHTPLLLLKNRLAKRCRQVGRNLTVHPAARVYAMFDDEVRGWDGSFQSYVIDQFWQEGIKLISIFPPPGVIGAGMPGFAQDNRDWVARLPHLGAFGVMISDTSTGRVRLGPDMGSLITYRMNGEDKGRLFRGLRLLSELYFEAGAREVFLPFHQEPKVLTSPDQLGLIDPARVNARAIESSAQHPLGSCRMGVDPKTSVVDVTGQMHEVANLYITDGSIVPSSVAVNPQITIMALATRLAWGLRERLSD